MALHAGFPYIDILRYGGKPPLSRAGDIRFCCPDADVANVFRIQVESEWHIHAPSNIQIQQLCKEGKCQRCFLSFSSFCPRPCTCCCTSPGEAPSPRALSAAQERQCLEEMAQGSQAARQKLIEHNLRLVAHIIKKYYASQNDQEDLISIGTIGLIKAIDTFDPAKGIRLSSYASRCIENEILMFFRSGRKSAQDVSLNEPIDTDKEGNALTILDTMAVDDTIVESIDTKMKSEKLYRFLQSSLTPREREVVCRRYGLLGFAPQPQRVVAKRLGISRSYISRIEKKALEKLRQQFQQERLL